MRIGSRKNDLPPLFKSNEEKRQIILEYSELILKGTPTKTIFEQLSDRFGWDTNQCIAFTREVRDCIAEATAENNEQVVQIHTLIYEDIFTRFDRLKFAKGKLSVMAQKEKLLKLYEEDVNEVVINNQTNIMMTQVNYDNSKLTPAQQQRLDQLMTKASSNEQEASNKRIEES